MAAPKNPSGNAGKGRPKGSLNKRTIEARQKLEEMGFDPIATLVELANETDDPEFRRKCASDLLPYVLPRLQAQKIELGGAAGMPNVKIEYVKPSG